MAEITKKGGTTTPDVEKPETKTATLGTKVEADLGNPEVAALVGGKIEEAKREAAEDLAARARARRVSERMGEEEKKETEAKKKIAEGLVNKKRDVTPNTIIASSHEGKRPDEIVVVNKVVATDKEVEESKRNRETEWNSSPFNPKNNTSVVVTK